VSGENGSSKSMGAIPLLLTIVVLAAFLGVIAWMVIHVGEPPRLADVVPSAPPTLGSNGELSPQYRGGYDPSNRLVNILAIVSPLITTIVGFFFGQRAGAAGTRAVKAEADQDKTKIANIALETGLAGPDLLTELRSKGLIRP
jgi:hypothetical protein